MSEKDKKVSEKTKHELSDHCSAVVQEIPLLMNFFRLRSVLDRVDVVGGYVARVIKLGEKMV